LIEKILCVFILALEEVKKIERKVVVMVLALAIVMLTAQTLAVMPVQAAPKEKLYFKLYMEGYSEYGENYHSSPKKALGMDYPDQKTFHVKEGPSTILYANITIGEGIDKKDFNTTNGDFAVTSSVSFNFIWKTLTAMHKAEDTITFSDGSTLEIQAVDKLDFLTFESEGTFVGHGTVNVQKVKIEGITYAAPLPSGLEGITREGTVMGWPT
jgi:hypothetical protein